MRNISGIMKIVVPVISVLLSFVIGALMILAIGGDPGEAYGYLMQGAFGSRGNLITTFVKATPLIFTGLAATVAYRCGVFNLGAQGQFVMGAVVSIWFSSTFSHVGGSAHLIISLMLGMLAGGLWGAIPGILKITRGLNEVIVSILLNYIAILFMGYLYSAPLREANLPQTPPVSTELWSMGTSGRLHVGIIMGAVIALAIHYFLFNTSGGFKLRAVGLNREAAGVNGFRVYRLMILSFVISGAIAGLGGSIELHGTQYRLMAGFGANYGFDGVAIALIAQLNPIATLVVAYLFAVLRTGATTMQVGSGMPTSVIDIIQALVIVFAVAGSALINLPKVRQFLSGLELREKKTVAMLPEEEEQDA